MDNQPGLGDDSQKIYAAFMDGLCTCVDDLGKIDGLPLHYGLWMFLSGLLDVFLQDRHLR